MYKNGKFVGVSEAEAMLIPWPEAPIPKPLTDEDLVTLWWVREPPQPMTFDAQVESEGLA